MINAKELFRTRIRTHIKEVARYLQYIFNGHLAIAMIFLIAAGAYYYQQILAELPENFPTAIVMSFFCAILLVYNPIQTLLKEADLVFLLPAEKRLNRYFRSALLYSYFVQLYLVVLLLAVLAPLYFTSYPDQSFSFYSMLGFLLVFLKGWNMVVTWWMYKIRDNNSRYVDVGIRYLLQFFIFYFLITSEFVFAGILTITLFLFFYYGYYLSSKHSLAWDQLIEKDQLRMRSFYRLANMFTDVPYLKAKVKKRSFLVQVLTRRLSFKQDKTLTYLYRITTIRSGEYLGMYIRLLIVGSLVIYYLPHVWIRILFGLLFLYLTAIQLMTIWYHHRTNLWMDLYPITYPQRQQAFVRWIRQLLFVHVCCYGLVFLFIGHWDQAILILGLGLLFIIAFTESYFKQKTKPSA